MAYFSLDFVKFFKELSKNNNKEWFDKNRKTYEKAVKKPFAAFVGEMIERIRHYEPEVKIEPKDAIFRINKDIRFSKDKTPYKTNVSANISEYGRKNKAYPGFYFQLSHDKIMLVGGAYMIETLLLQQIRSYIARNLKDFAAIYNDKNFKEKYGSILGEQHKRLPDEFKSVTDKEPLIANKQFYYSSELKPTLITQDDLPDKLMEYYVAGKKLNDFLRTAIKK